MVNKFILLLVFVFNITFLFAQELSIDFLKAKAFYNLEKYDSTIVYANKVKDKELIYNAIELKALSEFNLKNYDNALENFLKLNPELKLRNSIYITDLYAQKKDWENASYWLIKHLESKHKINPGLIKTDKYFLEFSSTKQWNDIWLKDWYTQLEVKIAEVQYLNSKNKYSRALEVTDEIIEIDANNDKIYYIRGEIYDSINDISNRVYSFKMANKLKPENKLYSFEYAKALLDEGKYKKSVQQFENAISLDKYNPVLFYYIAMTYYRYNDYINASKYIEYYRLISKNDADGIWLAGYIYKDNAEYEKALDEFDYGISLRIGRVGYYIGRAESLFNLKQYNQAATAFTDALDLTPNDGKIYYERGLAYFEAGDRVKACQDWKKASELGSYNADDMKLINCQ
jgi:tetratricopeptide (TPR) repeat protein